MKAAYQWIPTLYVLEGLPFALVATSSMILYKNFQISNAEITFYTSLFTLPWFLKPLIAPAFEGTLSKRTLLLLASVAMIFWVLLLAISLKTQHFFLFSIIIFFCIAFTSSIYDMNADGLYISQLDSKTQAQFIGVRTVSYHIGRLIAQGGIVYLASTLFTTYGVTFGWQFAFVFLAGLLLLFDLLSMFYQLKLLKFILIQLLEIRWNVQNLASK